MARREAAMRESSWSMMCVILRTMRSALGSKVKTPEDEDRMYPPRRRSSSEGRRSSLAVSPVAFWVGVKWDERRSGSSGLRGRGRDVDCWGCDCERLELVKVRSCGRDELAIDEQARLLLQYTLCRRAAIFSSTLNRSRRGLR